MDEKQTPQSNSTPESMEVHHQAALEMGNQPTNQLRDDMSRAAEAARAISGVSAPEQKGFIATAKEFQENHPIAANAIKLGAVASIVVAGGAAVHAEFTQPTSSQQASMDRQNTLDTAKSEYQDSINRAINAHYDQKQVIGQIPVEQGTTLYDPSVAFVKEKIGQDAFNANRERLNDALLTSTKEFKPQPDQSYVVVETDIDPSKANGDEFVTVPASQVISETGAIPAPNTH